MEWKFRSDLPIYTQLVAQIKEGIVAGAYAPGGRLPTVRELAAEAGVNPNTVQRALQELEREGLVFSQRTAGRFVTEDARIIGEAKQALAAELVRSFREGMGKLGCSREEILAMLKEEEETHGDSGM